MAHDKETQKLKESSKENKFKDTLNLPRTEFPIRPNAAIDDPNLINRWIKEEIYLKTFELNKNKKKFILHDGPPYANGNIHLGHAYNKILKDILCKAFRMASYHVPVIPGWDCHGLPIEQKVTSSNPNLPREELMKACREYAASWIEVQKKEFKRLGILMNWDNPYVTMDSKYEALTVKAFGIFVSQGFIERKNKTVPWCPTDATVLASAEIEYKDRKDPSIYVLFELNPDNRKTIFRHINEPIYFIIWTTTPWTLPLNKAIILKPNVKYSLIKVKNKLCVIGSNLVNKLENALKMEIELLEEFNSNIFSGSWALHPFIDNTRSPILFDESVELNEGTACVHSAPGCGPIDYEIGIKNNLEIYSPISADGKYTVDIKPIELKDMLVSDGQIWVIKKLIELDKLLFKTSITHSYPHCWRCHNGLIYRATPQWFFDLDRNNVKSEAIKSIENIKFIPINSRNFLKSTVQSRWEWCLSRQRIWGTPIPALLCSNCDNAYINQDFINKVADGIDKEGIEYWLKVDIKSILPEELKCNNCGKINQWKKEYDILDVWFDAGVSHYIVLYNNKDLAFPADVYLEGIDQHRGWFQSSLLTSLVLEKKACMKTIITHGYTVDAKGQKMSKSIGNVVAPDAIISSLGTDGLRLWVSSVGHDKDPSVSDTLLLNIAEVYRKIRNTCRFMLSNLYDFNLDQDSIVSKDLFAIDRYAFVKLYKLNTDIINAYEKADFAQVFHLLSDYCSTYLSSFYLDITKDRLYVEKPTGTKRRSAQTTYWYILDTITRLMAPILSFTSEYISDYYQKDKKESIHLQSFMDSDLLKKICWSYIDSPDTVINKIHNTGVQNIAQFENLHLEQWNNLENLRSIVLKFIEAERSKGIIKHSLEAKVKLYIDLENSKYNNLKAFFASIIKPDYSLEDFFKELFIISQFELVTKPDGLNVSQDDAIFVKVEHATGIKCPRCWNWDVNPGVDDLCRRCQQVLK